MGIGLLDSRRRRCLPCRRARARREPPSLRPASPSPEPRGDSVQVVNQYSRAARRRRPRPPVSIVG
ncbi:hypothetical protein HMPREF0762_01993 [Slackia exigua ATCC 700122]|uniref:Uncharacterized protein n=1 Tax=Slackia exigua (strain ATCC 700122 / DSM 15923 / CIP 105133 / JCM 11022 / KCTC 5966 / S-7) TaxID=649764 RepID=D0WJG5_SLAES|nr:hypothetical protein HMPREF0762_01993 [Slackia exigua ATCC 700122]